MASGHGLPRLLGPSSPHRRGNGHRVPRSTRRSPVAGHPRAGPRPAPVQLGLVPRGGRDQSPPTGGSELCVPVLPRSGWPGVGQGSVGGPRSSVALRGGSPRPPPPSGRFVRGLTAPRLEPRSLLPSSRGHGPGRVRVVSLPLGHCSLGPDLGDLFVARLSLQAQQPKRVPLAGTRAFSGDTAPPQWKPSWGCREGSGDGEAKARSTC